MIETLKKLIGLMEDFTENSNNLSLLRGTATHETYMKVKSYFSKFEDGERDRSEWEHLLEDLTNESKVIYSRYENLNRLREQIKEEAHQIEASLVYISELLHAGKYNINEIPRLFSTIQNDCESKILSIVEKIKIEYPGIMGNNGETSIILNTQLLGAQIRFWIKQFTKPSLLSQINTVKGSVEYLSSSLSNFIDNFESESEWINSSSANTTSIHNQVISELEVIAHSI